MKVIDGKDAILGRLASRVAKDALLGEEIAIVNCEEIIVTGNKKFIKDSFHEKRGRVGSGQSGPKHSRTDEKIVKRAIRGMLPNAREGRGKDAFKRIKCYKGMPKEFEGSELVEIAKIKRNKFLRVREISK